MSVYTHADIEAAWKTFNDTMVYRYLVAGKWTTTTDFDEARDAHTGQDRREEGERRA